MDWLQFTASVIGSLAWPFATLIILFAIRRHLGPLVARIIELTLPGGTKIVFGAELAKGRESLEEIPTLETKAVPKGVAKLLHGVEVMSYEPQSAIAVAYDEVEKILIELRRSLELPVQSNLPTVVGKLVKRKLVRPEVRDLFESVTRARNIAAHASAGDITPVEAFDFAKQASALLVEFQIARAKLKG